MSEHAKVSGMVFNSPARAANVEWAGFLQAGVSGSELSAIDQFYEIHRGLTVLSTLSSGSALQVNLQPLLAGQVLLSYVSATEQYMRTILAHTVRLCPHIRARAASQQIPFSAVDYYHPSDIAHALTERISFSEPGKLASVLNQRLGVIVSKNSSLERCIDDYEKLCQLRHALVHSRGVVNSSNALPFSLPNSRSQYSIHAGQKELESAAAICLGLVREVNDRTAKTVIWCWLQEGTLVGKRRQDRRLLEQFKKVFTSNEDEATGEAGIATDDLFLICQDVLDDLAQQKAGPQTR